MARRRESGIDDEKRSYGSLWLLLSLLLMATAIWALLDDNFFRRPWKMYQAGFNRLDIQRAKDAIAKEDERLAADPTFQEKKKALDEARASLESGATAAEVATIEAQLHEARLADQSKDLNLRFVKSELEELRFQFDDAKHHGHSTDEIQATIDDRERLREEREKIYGESQATIAGFEAKLKELRGGVKKAEDEVVKLTTARDELQQKLETISLGRFFGPKESAPFFGTDWQPKIPKIQQVVMPEFDRNNFNQAIDRVDRCMSCHAAIDKAGYEDQPNPWKTHPKRDTLLAKHPVDRFGCTPCHQGDGPSVNSPEKAHGNFLDEHGHVENVDFQEHPMLRGKKMQANCIKCHQGLTRLDGADVIARGEKLFVDLGCHGCHLAEGYEELAKEHGVAAVGPSLRRIAAKDDPGWLVRWVKNPHEFRPRTRMPSFMLGDDEAVQIVAYLLSASREPSAQWLAEGGPAIEPGGPLAERGKALVDSIGCRACHALSPDEVAGQVGANKDIAPNLSNIAEKTHGLWIYNWIKNPRRFSEVARMPSLRLTDDEARSITAYLLTLGERKPAPADLAHKLANPVNVAAGEKLVRKYGCPGCHDIPGMEKESRIGAELSAFGAKTKEELFFGDRTDIPETWDDWTYHKLHEPRTYATKWIEQLMPQFDLAEEDIEALRVFLASRTEGKYPAKYAYRGPGEKALGRGELVIARYNCMGCHVIEGRGGDVRRLYEASPSTAPPIIKGEGEKVQAAWLFNFLKAPSPIRPWLKVRMPTFGFSNEEANELVSYFQAFDRVEVPYFHIDRASLSPAMVAAGEQLASNDYLACFSCHQRGEQKPEGPEDGWAPDLAMAHVRLSPDWIVKWLNDPQKLMPGTKMPTFYADPNATDGPTDILDGDDDAQIRALRDYVISLGLPKHGPSPTQTAAIGTPGHGAMQ